MKNLFAVATLLIPIGLAGCSHPRPVAYYPPPPAASQAAQQGYHDGFDAAQRDIARGAPPDPGRHPHFRNPPVPPFLSGDYRNSFRNGYEQVFRHGPPPSGY